MGLKTLYMYKDKKNQKWILFRENKKVELPLCFKINRYLRIKIKTKK